MSATAASLWAFEVSSPAASPFPKSANKPFLANLRYGKFNLGSFRGRNQFLFEISQATFLVLANQFVDIFTGSVPIAGGCLGQPNALDPCGIVNILTRNPAKR